MNLITDNENDIMSELNYNITADVMMAKVARWLRLMGIRVNNPKFIDDTLILKSIKKYKHPALLTSDVEFHKRAIRAGVKSVCVPAHLSNEDQVRYVLNELDLKVDKSKIGSLCTKCGHRLIRIDRSKASEYDVPKNSLDSYDEFFYCKYCKKVYWHGSHWVRISKIINEISNNKLKAD